MGINGFGLSHKAKEDIAAALLLRVSDKFKACGLTFWLGGASAADSFMSSGNSTEFPPCE